VAYIMTLGGRRGRAEPEPVDFDGVKVFVVLAEHAARRTRTGSAVEGGEREKVKLSMDYTSEFLMNSFYEFPSDETRRL
jgi:hypothetical protein